ncbi:hypothetical protein CR513_35396, partial [Mucuna pruriens]
MVRRLVNKDNDSKRENVFHSRCHVKGKLSSIIIDGGNRKYNDEILYDVVPIETTHILLGRLWQFDRKVTHDGVTNRFSFVHMRQKVTLKPLSPRESIQKRKNEKKSDEKICPKEKCENKRVEGKKALNRKKRAFIPFTY